MPDGGDGSGFPGAGLGYTGRSEPAVSTRFTRHAFQRVHERLSLLPGEVATLLDYDLAVNIGVERNGHRLHRLFYSPPDRCCFVAVQDERDGTVVTILPLDYHANIAWPVSEAAQRAARSLVVPAEEDAAAEAEAPPPRPPAGRPRSFRLAVYARHVGDGRVRVFSLGSVPAEPYGAEPERYLAEPDNLEDLADRVRDTLPVDWIPEHAVVRTGSRRHDGGRLAGVDLDPDGHPRGRAAITGTRG